MDNFSLLVFPVLSIYQSVVINIKIIKDPLCSNKNCVKNEKVIHLNVI